MYEIIHTALPVMEHDVVPNFMVCRSAKPNVFQSAVEAGEITAAAACYWFSELYNRTPYDPVDDHEVDAPGLLIQHGRLHVAPEYLE